MRQKARHISPMPEILWDFRDLCWDEPNAGWVSVGVGNDMAAFAVESLRQW